MMVPSGVATMIANGHEVIVETDAGAGAGFPDAEYIAGRCYHSQHARRGLRGV